MAQKYTNSKVLRVKVNRGALQRFSLIDKYVAGIQLLGWEVKSIKQGNCDFDGAYVLVQGNELFLRGLTVSAWMGKQVSEQEKKRDKRLLATKEEIRQIKTKMKRDRGLTILPLGIDIINNLIKVEIAVVKSLKKYQRKELIKQKEMKRDLHRTKREHNLT